MATSPMTCPHAFEATDPSPFVETERARHCQLCQRIEVLFENGWLELEDYLRVRRERHGAE